jgi:hyperosmotically inducible protein
MKAKFITAFALAVAVFLSACGGKSDADLQKAASDKLTADSVTGVSVAVKDGNATLTGEVADITVKSKAETSVKTVEGIKTVTNNITLKPLPPAPTPAGDDKMLEGTINQNLKKENLTGVKVAVSNGEVTLSGEVASTADLAKAMQAASSTNPKRVVNMITVKK